MKKKLTGFVKGGSGGAKAQKLCMKDNRENDVPYVNPSYFFSQYNSLFIL